MMSEIEYIKEGLSKNGHVAFDVAKSKGHAIILHGNDICSVDSDGTRTVLSRVAKSAVRVSSKSYRLKK
jgi:hypothetical protein